jgi:hypothetical protein
MRLRKTIYSTQKVCGQSLKIESENFVDVTHSQKRTFKGSRIARVQGLVEEIQADKLDRKNERNEHRNKRKQERQRNKGL